jgi:hypothetical protein
METAWEIIRGGKRSAFATVLVMNHNDERPNAICIELRQCGMETQMRALLREMKPVRIKTSKVWLMKLTDGKAAFRSKTEPKDVTYGRQNQLRD